MGRARRLSKLKKGGRWENRMARGRKHRRTTGWEEEGAIRKGGMGAAENRKWGREEKEQFQKQRQMKKKTMNSDVKEIEKVFKNITNQTQDKPVHSKTQNCFPPLLPHLHCTEEKWIFIGGMAWSQVVEVEYPQIEDSEVCTDTEVGYNHNGYELAGEKKRERQRQTERKRERQRERERKETEKERGRQRISSIFHFTQSYHHIQTVPT